jgi:hypothetical protein
MFLSTTLHFSFILDRQFAGTLTELCVGIMPSEAPNTVLLKNGTVLKKKHITFSESVQTRTIQNTVSVLHSILLNGSNKDDKVSSTCSTDKRKL